jgi:hypothetical protein
MQSQEPFAPPLHYNFVAAQRWTPHRSYFAGVPSSVSRRSNRRLKGRIPVDTSVLVPVLFRSSAAQDRHRRRRPLAGGPLHIDWDALLVSG